MPPYAGQGAGGLEGLKLIVKHDYIKGIFALSCVFMVEIAILDYTTKARDGFVSHKKGSSPSPPSKRTANRITPLA